MLRCVGRMRISNNDCSADTYYNLDEESNTYQTCVSFGTRCAEKGSDDCNPEGQYCDYDDNDVPLYGGPPGVCVDKKPNNEQCRYANECQTNMCRLDSGNCAPCENTDNNTLYTVYNTECPVYHVPDTTMDFERYPCENGTCTIPFNNGA